jgi:hypothetical protein
LEPFASDSIFAVDKEHTVSNASTLTLPSLRFFDRERARRDLDKNSFEPKGKNLMFIIGSTAFQRGP